MVVAGQDPQFDRQAEFAGSFGIGGRLPPQFGQFVAADGQDCGAAPGRNRWSGL